MSSPIELTQNGIEERLKTMLTLAQSTKASARLYPLYQQFQLNRFMTEGASEGFPWPKLKPEYAEYKKKRYARFPGGGTKMLIGTSTLAGAVIGPGAPFEGTSFHRATFQPYSMRIEVSTSGQNAEGKPFTYPAFVGELRPFMKFGQKSIQALKEALKQYLIGK